MQNTTFKIVDTLLNEILETKIGPKLHPCQSGFRKKIGTMHNLYVLQDMMLNDRDLIVVWIDFRKAYDSINRKKMLHRLRNKYNIGEFVLNTLQSIYSETLISIK